MSEGSELPMKQYICKLCNKRYSSASSLCNHNKKFHSKNVNQSQLLSTNCQPNVNQYQPKININKSLTCDICNKQFNTRQAKSKHKKSCTYNLEKENKLLKQQLLELQNNQKIEFEKFKTDLLKSIKIHPKTLEKINKNLTNNINNGTINNGTINNNTINIVKFGSEELSHILSKQEIINILNTRYQSLEESIKLVHLNDKRPQFKNIYITNLKDDLAYTFNGIKFEAVNKYDVISDLINNHICNIEVSFDEYKEELLANTVPILDKFIKKMSEEHKFEDKKQNQVFKSYKDYKIRQIKLLIYNKCDKPTKLINIVYDKTMLCGKLIEQE